MDDTKKPRKKKDPKKLTQLLVDRLAKPAKGEGRKEVYDATLPSFGIRISEKDARSYFVMTRLHGTLRRFTVGTTALYPKVDQARDRAREIIQMTGKGIDPLAVKRAAEEVRTVAWVCEQFIERHAKEHNKNDGATAKGLLNKHVVPALGKRDIRSITKADVSDLLARLKKDGMGTGRNRVFSTFRKMMNWAWHEAGYLDGSPVLGMKAPTKETSRDRTLTPEELVQVWRAAEAVGGTTGPFAQILLLTGQRLGEVAGMRWDELDLDKKTWTLPSERTKASRAHRVPLSDQAALILAAQPKLGTYVFAGRRGFRAGQAEDVAMGGFSKRKDAIDKATGPMETWTFHDLRRSCATGLGNLGVEESVISRILNHAAKGVTGKVYNLSAYEPQMRAACTKWSDYVARLLDPSQTGKVHQLFG